MVMSGHALPVSPAHLVQASVQLTDGRALSRPHGDVRLAPVAQPPTRMHRSVVPVSAINAGPTGLPAARDLA